MAVELELRVAWQQHIGGVATSPSAGSTRCSARYRAPGRHYHDMRHVAWVVRHVADDRRRHPVDDVDAVVAAAFFHDAVYDPARGDNEAASAALAERALGEIGWAAPRVRHVADLVMATAAPRRRAGRSRHRVLLAADLAVLAAEPARYADYATAVRREYAHVDDDGVARRVAAPCCTALLERPHLFPPELGLDDWERRARANLTPSWPSLVAGSMTATQRRRMPRSRGERARGSARAATAWQHRRPRARPRRP